MPIIEDEKESALKQDLLKQSLGEDLAYKLNKNNSFSNPKQTFFRTKLNYRNFEEQISDWNSTPVFRLKDKQRTERLVLPKMKTNLKNRNIDDLTCQLLKYEQNTYNDSSPNYNFPLNILKKMTHPNPQRLRDKPKQIQSPKKINIKLQFPERYQIYQLQNQESMGLLPFQNSIHGENQFRSGSFYTKSLTRGLIPSMKKFLNASFQKKSLLRSQSQMVSCPKKKFSFGHQQFSNFSKEIKQKYDEQFVKEQNIEKQKRTKLRLDRKSPVNFLIYSQRKQNAEKLEREQLINEAKRSRRKRPNLSDFSMNSQDYKFEGLKNESVAEKGLKQCIFLNLSKKTKPI